MRDVAADAAELTARRNCFPPGTHLAELDCDSRGVPSTSSPWHLTCSTPPREISTICSREEPSNEAFYSELDDSGCGIGAARPARRQLGPAADPIDYAASADHRRTCAADRSHARRGHAAGVGERASASGAVRTERHSRGVTDWHGEDTSRRAEAAPECRSNRSASPKPASGAATAGSANWSTDVAAADRILTELLGRSGHDRRDHAGSSGHDRFDGSGRPRPPRAASPRPRSRSTRRRAPSCRKCARTSPRSPRR